MINKMKLDTLKFMYKNLDFSIRKVKLLVVCSLIFLGTSSTVFSQKSSNLNKKEPKITIINDDPELSLSIVNEFRNIIKTVYPKLVKDFNKKARMDITVKIDTVYDGVAYAHNGRVTVSSQWLYKRPNDVDLMTHEIMHIVQSYPSNSGPGWLTEGIADFVRFRYGINNVKARWSLPEFSVKQHYKDSYRVTARFLEWLSQNYKKNIVNKLDKKMRSNKYSPKLWKKYTGYNIDQLWGFYTKNPNLK